MDYSEIQNDIYFYPSENEDGFNISEVLKILSKYKIQDKTEFLKTLKPGYISKNKETIYYKSDVYYLLIIYMPQSILSKKLDPETSDASSSSLECPT